MESTVSTTRTSRLAARLAAAAAGLVLGVGLVGFCGTILSAALAALPGDPLAAALRDRQDVDDEGLVALIVSREAALSRFPGTEWRRELATASLLPRRDRPLGPEAVVRSADQTLAVLQDAPASAQDWLRLAILEATFGERPKAVDYLSTALMTGGDAPRQRLAVLRAGFQLWPDLPPEIKLQVLRAMRHEWEAGHNRLWLVAEVSAAGYLPLARMTLGNDPALDRYLQRLAR
jgi:hypothetical protein